MAKNPINYRKMLTFLKEPLHFSVMVSFGASYTALTNCQYMSIYIFKKTFTNLDIFIKVSCKYILLLFLTEILKHIYINKNKCALL
jgi:hypothetical protein